MDREQLDGVLLDSVVADSVGNVYCIAGEYYGDADMFAAYHYDKRVGELNVIIGMATYEKCLAAIGKYREGVRI